MFGRTSRKKSQFKSDAELLQKNEELNQRLEAISEVNQNLVGVVDKQSVFDLITRKLTRSVKMNFPTVWLYNESDQSIGLASYSVPKSIQLVAEKAIGKPLSELKFSASNPEHKKSTYFKVIETGESLFSEDLYAHTYPFLNEQVAKILKTMAGMKLAISVPIVVQGKNIGVLSAIWKERELSKENKLTMYTFANQIATAIYNSELFEANKSQIRTLESQNKDLSSLYNLSSQVSSSLDPATVAEKAVNSLPQDDRMIGAVMTMYNDLEEKLEIKAYTKNKISAGVDKVLGGIEKFSVNLTDEKYDLTTTAQAFRNQQPAFTTDLSQYLSPPVPANLVKGVEKLVAIQSVVVYPLTVRDRKLGTIAYFLKDKKFEDLEEQRRRLYQTFTSQIAVSLENALLFKETEEAKEELAKALLDLRESRRRERDMIDIMGHELRTPMSIVKNALSIMDMHLKKSGQIPKDKQEKYVDIGLESARREAKLIETLLSATKTDAKGFQLTLEKVDMKDVIHDSIVGTAAGAKKKGLKLETDVPEEDVFAYCDRTRVQEIVDNFLSNAIKYTSEGSVKVILEQKNDFVWVRVQDTGHGISKEEIPMLGKKFFRAKQHLSESTGNVKVIRPGGTGLGLYVSFGLAKIMDGDYKVESTLGKGSTFSFKVPRFTGQEVEQVERQVSDYLMRDDEIDI